jgi:single-strand DNA-binding protein
MADSNSVNKVILVGRLGQDPEVRFTQGGTAVASLSVATDETWKDQSGERQRRTEWHRVVAWRRLAEICGQYLSKGRLVYIEGKLQTRSWQDKEGNKRYSTEIQADNLVMLSGGRPEEGQAAPAAQPAAAAQPAPAAGSDSGTSDDDIPF